MATIVDKDQYKVKIHYEGWNSKWDTWCDYKYETQRFAECRSISREPNTRFKDPKIRDYLDINPIQRHRGWRVGQIRRRDKYSGQVQVVYKEEGQEFLYWAHLNNPEEIAPFMTLAAETIALQQKIAEFEEEEVAVLTIQSYFRGFHMKNKHLRQIKYTKQATMIIWSAYRRNQLKLWMDDKVQERKQNRSIFDEEIIYLLNVTVRKGMNLQKRNNYMRIQCFNHKYDTKTVQDSSNPEWNQSFTIKCYRQPEEIAFHVIHINEISNSSRDELSGNYVMDINSDHFTSGHEGIFNLQNSDNGKIEVAVSGRIFEPFKVIRDFAALQAMDNDDQKINEAMIKKMLNKYQSERQNIGIIIKQSSKDTAYQPLHLFNERMVHDKIKYWTLHDINYQRDLLETMKLFSKHSLSGKVINLTSINNCKKMIYEDLTEYLESKTIDIMFDEFDTYNKEHQNEIQSKSAPEIAYIIYNLPLERLLSKILRDNVDGQSFINRYQSGERWIKKYTGWSKDNQYQINAMLLKYISMTKKDFNANMSEILIGSSFKILK